ncbi:hypothetical protein FACS189476_00700 [Spirochaetia bacterium]|nr:hypothetical protein FACS189476_00700 [Spirochaetia bacterium]
MKRNKFFVLGVLAAVLTFGLVVVGCDPGGDDDPPPTGDAAKLQGTWNDTVYTQVLVFSGSNVDIGGGMATGTFVVNETAHTLTMNVSAMASDNVFAYSFSNSDNTLTLSGGDSQVNGTYAKAP